MRVSWRTEPVTETSFPGEDQVMAWIENEFIPQLVGLYDEDEAMEVELELRNAFDQGEESDAYI